MAVAVAEAGAAQKAAKSLKNYGGATNAKAFARRSRNCDCALRDAPMRATRCRSAVLPRKYRAKERFPALFAPCSKLRLK
jgi:hypothetical protein